MPLNSLYLAVFILLGVLVANAAPNPLPTQVTSVKQSDTTKSHVKRVGRASLLADLDTDGSSKKEFQIHLRAERVAVDLQSQRPIIDKEEFYMRDIIPHIFPYMLKYTKDNLKIIRDLDGKYEQYTTNIVMAGARNDVVRIECFKPSVMVAAGIVLGVQNSENRNDKQVADAIFALLSNLIEHTTAKRPQIVQQMHECKLHLSQNINMQQVLLAKEATSRELNSNADSKVSSVKKFESANSRLTNSMDEPAQSGLDSLTLSHTGESTHKFNPGPFSFITLDQKVLGSGSFGKVYLAHTRHGQPVAVKEIDYGKIASIKGRPAAQELEFVKAEADICSTVNHVNLLQCSSTPEVNNEKELVYLVFEYCDAGDFLDYVQNPKNSKEKTQCGLYQVIRGIEYLHHNNVAHLDIKPENILVQSNGIVKLGDYGLAKRMKTGEKMILGTRGSLSYISPEMLIASAKYKQARDQHKSKSPVITSEMMYDPFAADIWSIGVTYLATRLIHSPWDSATVADGEYSKFKIQPRQFLEHLNVKTSPRVEHRLSPPELDFLLLMLQPDPNKRITAAQIIQNPWFNTLASKCSADVQFLLGH